MPRVWILSRLVTFENFSGTAGGDVWPAAEGLGLLFAQGLLLPAYTITGFDASAHAAEETIGAAESVPRGIIRSVLVSGMAGWILLGTVVLAAPKLSEVAAQGEGAFLSIINGVLPRPLGVSLIAAIVLAQYLCGLATVTSASRMAFAFARDGGLPFSTAVRWVCPRRRSPPVAIWGVAAASVLFTFYTPVYATITAVCTIFLYVVVRRADSLGRMGARSDLDSDGALGPRALVSAAGCGEHRRLRRADCRGDAAAQSAVGVGSGRVRAGDDRGLVWHRAPSFPRAACHVTRRDTTRFVSDMRGWCRLRRSRTRSS